jgi:hypothetical protein
MAQGKWRRGWDSNPRMGFTPINGLANPSAETVNPFDKPQKPDKPETSKERKERRARRKVYLAKALESAQYDPRSGSPHKSLEEILSHYVVMPNGCHEWTRATNEGGYGLVCLMLDGVPNTMPASRLQWMRLKGKPGDGMDILHTCDNPPCINIDHLFEGTPRDNIHDMMAKGRQNFAGLRLGPSAQKAAHRRRA